MVVVDAMAKEVAPVSCFSTSAAGNDDGACWPSIEGLLSEDMQVGGRLCKAVPVALIASPEGAHGCPWLVICSDSTCNTEYKSQKSFASVG